MESSFWRREELIDEGFGYKALDELCDIHLIQKSVSTQKVDRLSHQFNRLLIEGFGRTDLERFARLSDYASFISLRSIEFLNEPVLHVALNEPDESLVRRDASRFEDRIKTGVPGSYVDIYGKICPKWSVNPELRLRFFGDARHISAVETSRDRCWTLFVKENEILVLNDLSECMRIIESTTPTLSVAFCGNGPVVLLHAVGSIQLLRVDTGEYLKSFEWGSPTRVCFDDTIALHCCFSPNQTAAELVSLLSGLPVQSLGGHHKKVTAFCLSPSGAVAAVGLANGTFRIWSTRGHHLPCTVCGHQSRIESLAINIDDTRLVSTSTDQTVCYWNLTEVRSGACQRIAQRELPKEAAVSCSFDYSGRIVYQCGGSSGRFYLWDPSKPAEEPDLALGLLVDALGNTALDHVWFKLEHWLGRVRTLPPQCLFRMGLKDRVQDLDWSPKQNLCVSCSDSRVLVWDTGGAEQAHCRFRLLSSLSHCYATCVALSPDGTMIASGGDGAIRLWDVTTSNYALRNILKADDCAMTLAFSPDCRLLAVGFDDVEVGHLNIWEVATGTLLHSWRGFHSRINCLRFSPKADRIVCVSAGAGVQVLDPCTGQRIRSWSIRGQISADAVFLRTDECVLAIAYNTSVKVVRWQGAKEEHVLGTIASEEYRGFRPLCFSPDLRMVAVAVMYGQADHVVEVREVSSGRQLALLRGHRAFIRKVTWKGLWVVSGSFDGTVRAHDLSDVISDVSIRDC
eukprot:Rmarinus@m.9273